MHEPEEGLRPALSFVGRCCYPRKHCNVVVLTLTSWLLCLIPMYSAKWALKQPFMATL